MLTVTQAHLWKSAFHQLTHKISYTWLVESLQHPYNLSLYTQFNINLLLHQILIIDIPCVQTKISAFCVSSSCVLL